MLYKTLFAFLAAIAVPAQAGIVTFNGTRANTNPLSPPGSGRCAPTYFNTVSIGGGNGTSTGTSNFGVFSSTQSHCLVTAPPTALVDGIFTYNFSAGDSLSGTYTGNTTFSGTPGILNAVENLVVTGGTGRFLGASGNLTATGTLRFVSGAGVYAGDVFGQLNLPAVPEPATWAMMIAGFGAVGAALRRRRRLASASSSVTGLSLSLRQGCVERG